jgi:hypothetical protein
LQKRKDVERNTLVKIANSKIRQEHCTLGENKKAEL